MHWFQWDYIDSNMYVILENREALIIDPVLTTEVKDFWANRDMKRVFIVLTHEHFDHINGLNWLKKQFHCEVIANSVCAANIQSASKNLSDKSDVILLFNDKMRERSVKVFPFCSSADIQFQDVKKMKWQNHDILLISTPGHTNGSVCMILDDAYLFTGDTLLEIPTITRLPGGSKSKFEQITIPVLRDLIPKIIKVYPGHGNKGNLHEMLARY